MGMVCPCLHALGGLIVSPFWVLVTEPFSLQLQEKPQLLSCP